MIELTKPERRGTMRAQCIANTIWCYGKLMVSSHRVESLSYKYFILNMLYLANDMLPYFKPQELGQLGYTAAKLNYLDASLYDAVVDYTISRLSIFTNRELTLQVWAFGKVNIRINGYCNQLQTSH